MVVEVAMLEAEGERKREGARLMVAEEGGAAAAGAAAEGAVDVEVDGAGGRDSGVAREGRSSRRAGHQDDQ